MLTLSGYQSLTQIYESTNSLVYRGIRSHDSQPVILKVLKQDYPTPDELTRYKSEYQITRSLNLDGVVKAYALEPYQRTLAIVLEDFGGCSLKQLMNGQALSLGEFLPIAIQIADIVGHIHSANIIHKDINPSNIILNRETQVLKIVDFGISTQLTRENPTLKNPHVLEGTLAYISPEQTGRMNRFLDYRTDFYSLGITFYELLTGQLPFATTEALELVHCHMAKQPMPPHQVKQELPKPISDIVMKLMAKMAEDRYQSAWGIKADLQECLKQFQVKGTISQFCLGDRDISDKFQIPQKLYGRHSEVETLLAAFERVAAGKQPEQLRMKDKSESKIEEESEQLVHPSFANFKTSEMMLVTGYSGIGKSALVAEVHKPITEKRGYFIEGKFDQFQQNIPYSAVVIAFKNLVRQLLTESETQLRQWREKLLAALGSNGQVIIDVMSDVELILGKQPPVPELGPQESQNRFNLVFQNFIRAFCTKQHPLVIFLDDLQWADSATLKLIKLMMTDTDTQYLFVIGAYRDNEVSPTHPLMMTLEEIQKERATVKFITLSPLEIEPIIQLISDTLHDNTESVKPLAELVQYKTGGNPFFINQFLKTLHAEGLITFNRPQSSKLLSPSLERATGVGALWEWDIEQIEAQNITDNVAELMISNLKKLPESTQYILRLAACIGASFDLETLSIICEKLKPAIFSELMTAIKAGFILPTSELDTDLFIQDYKFLHDRVQQAAYSLINEEQKTDIHLQIGRLLLQNTSPEALSEDIFKIIDHLNEGIERVTEQTERDEIAKLNLMAGQKAKAATAYWAAVKYFHVARELLSANSWENSYDLTLAIHEEAVEAAYLNGDFTAMEQLTEVVLTHAKTVLEKVKIYDVKIQFAGAQGNFKEAIKIGLVVLKLLGVILPEEPSQLDIQRGFQETAALCVGKEIEELIDLPDMTEPEPQAAIYILSSISAAAYIAAPELMLLIVLSMVNLSIKYGHGTWSAFSYACYGLILCGVVQDIELGYKFGKLSLSLTKRLNAKRGNTRAFEVLGAHVMHWKEHFRETLPIVSDGYQSGVETGEFEFAGYCAFFICDHSYFVGCELTELEQKMLTYGNAISQIRRENPFKWVAMFRQSVLNLLGQSENPIYLIGDAYNEEQWLPLAIQANDRLGIHLLYLNKLILCYLFDEKDRAIENATRAKQYLDGVTAMVVVPVFHFYDSLVHLSIFAEASNPEKEVAIARVNTNQKKMQKWAHHAPMNHQHKFDLVEAEKARVLDRVVEAIEFYERAIKGARENGFIQEEALAYELAAKFYLARDMEKFAQTYMTEAHYAYTRWGAKAKVDNLEAKYPQFLTKSSTKTLINTPGTIHPKTTTGSQSAEALDLATVIKASQAISGEIVFDKLLGSLMKIIIENAGARSGCLILETQGELRIEASGEVDSDRITVLQSIPIEDSDAIARVCTTLINYVARTSESVVLNDATQEGNFINDPYIKEHQPKSILCVPLINQGKLISIVYLENNLTTGAFTPERLELIKILSSSAAISIENARLYTNLAEYNRTLETKVEERTAELATAKKAAEAANEAKSTFLANMSHELRTPLNAILGFAQIMTRSQTLSSENQENIGIITRSGEHLLTLIDQVLDLSKIEAGRITLNEKNFDLYRLLEDLEDMFRLKAEDKGLCLIGDRAPDVPRYIRTDEVKLRQVFINLLNNALKFTHEGGVSLRVRVANDRSPIPNSTSPARNPEQFTIPHEQLTLTFEVSDTGEGIAPDELDSIFEAFVQTQTGKESQEGTGLGLPISRKFVELMGGEMTVSSEVGRGTTFSFNIRVALIDAADLKTQKTTRRAIALEPNQPRYRILIVDDQWENRQLLIKLLNPLGFELQEASNGKEAVEIWNDWEPHLIWMDMRMPVLDGYEATQQIKATTKGQATAIIALTASSFEAERSIVLSAGCDDFLRKPFRETDIIDLMHKHLGVRYVYENEMGIDAIAENKDDVLSAEVLAAQPAQWVANLKQSLLNVDLNFIAILIEEIREKNANLAIALSHCIDNFDYDTILNLIPESDADEEN